MYIHCLAHSLNLSVQDMVKGSPVVRDTLDLCLECTKLVKASPKRESWLQLIKERTLFEEEETDLPSKAGIKLFCRTRYASNIHSQILILLGCCMIS